MDNMTFKDRTLEFANIAGQFRTKLQPPDKKQTKAEVVINTISVNKRASEIGRCIASTAAKLKELAELAKSKSPFSDPTEKIEFLTEKIKVEINKIKLDIEDLDRFISQNKRNKQASDHSVTVIHSLNSNLLNATKELSDALQIRTQNLKEQHERYKKFNNGRRPGNAPVLRPIFLPDVDPENNQDDVVIPVISTMSQVRGESDLIIQRVNAVRDIEAQMSEIQNIFKMLSNLVAQQTEQLQRIEENMDTTVVYADSALAELLKYLKGMSSDRWLIIKAFLFLLFFIVIWFMFFA